MGEKILPAWKISHQKDICGGIFSTENFYQIYTCEGSKSKLERLRSEDTPRRPVITLTIDQFILNPKSILLISSYRIPSQKKVKAEKIRKICEKI